MKKSVLAVFFLCLSISQTAFANHGHEGHSLEDKYFGKVWFLLENGMELGLTEDQINQIENIQFDVKRALIDAKSKTELAALDIYQELRKDKPDLKKIDQILDRKYAAKANSAKNVAHSIVNTKAVLSPEQQAKAKELYGQHKSKQFCPYSH